MTAGHGAGVLVVDAANVVGSRPDGWWRDRAGATERLVSRLLGVAGTLPAERTVVVLEGAARAAKLPEAVVPEPAAGPGPQLTVVRADAGGDDEIVATVRRLREAEVQVTVVTADRGLRLRVAELGARTLGPGWLWARL